jgi:hypothetical protein
MKKEIKDIIDTIFAIIVMMILLIPVCMILGEIM